MKKIIILVTAFLLAAVCANAHKYALIIAIGNYDQNKTGWYPISADHDVPLIQKTLVGLGFDEKDIMYLKDEQATKAGMVNAFNELLAKVSEGDEVVIHYSGHGHQIFDDNGDEIDGLDECLVCYDAPMKMTEGYDGSLHFRDDELGAVVEKFRIKLGKDGHILLFLDSCHSGTGTRGAAKVRGGAPALVPAGWHAPSGAPKTDGKVGMGMGATSSRGAVDANNLAKYVVFSGASANELNYETFDDENNSVGSLSYCLYKSFSQMKEGDTYRQVFARIMAEMAAKAPFQNPAIEGDVDFTVFGGDFTTQAEYFNMTSVKNDSVITINAGRLVGVNPGTTVAFVAPGTSRLDDNTEVITTGRVISSENFKSRVALDTKKKFKTAQDAWVFVKARTFTDQKIKVSIDPEMDPALKNALNKEISNSSFAELTTDAPEITLNYGRTRGAKVISVSNAMYNKELHKISNVDEAALESDVMSTLNNFAQGKIIKDLDFTDDRFNIVMELLPVEADIYDDGTFEITEYLDKDKFVVNEVPGFTAENMAVIKVTNNGTKKAFFNIIDIQPDGFINPIIPTVNDSDGREYYLEPGESAILKNTIVMFGPPYGNEVFKVIATDKPFNLSATIMQHGSSSRGDSSNIFESALGIGNSGVNTRGAATISAKKQDDKMGTFEYTFKIMEGEE